MARHYSNEIPAWQLVDSYFPARTDKKENQIFLIYDEMRKYLATYEEAVSQIWLCNFSILNFIIYEESLIFFFISAPSHLIDVNINYSVCCFCFFLLRISIFILFLNYQDSMKN